MKLLFHVLSIQLGSARVGCTVGNMVVNHLMFADDICVFSPNISGLQCLLNICGNYAAEHEITFNCNKTIGVLFPAVKTLFRAYYMPMYPWQLWSKYTQTSLKHLRAVYNNAY